jgi:hypothetical protein
LTAAPVPRPPQPIRPTLSISAPPGWGRSGEAET